MSTNISILQNNNIKWGGVALMVNGILFALVQLWHPADADPNALLHSLWSPLHVVLGLSLAVGAYGVVQLGQAQRDKAGRFGKIAVGVALFGAITGAIASFIEVILPSLVATYSGSKSMVAMLDPSGPVPWVLPLMVPALVGFLFGYVLLGIAIMRAKVLPRLAGLLLIISTLVHFNPIHAVKLVGGVGFGLTLIWLGVALWSESRQPVASLELAR